MNKPPAFQFYAENFLSGTDEFSCEEVGAYIRLLCQQWHRKGLPNDPKTLCKMARCTEDALASIMHKFRIYPDGLLRNERMERGRKSRNAFVKSRSKNAQAGWEGERGKKRRDALASKVHGSSTCIDHGLQSSTSYINTPTPLMLRIGGWFGRKASTEWQDAEIKALKHAKKATEEDLALLEEYQTAPESAFEDGKSFRRTSILTLLRHWPGELDRALAWKSKSNGKSHAKKQVDPDFEAYWKEVGGLESEARRSFESKKPSEKNGDSPW